ncbi:unnamed protein product [Leptidea sinapis]|uniref:Uncharacterized protein n=1 Tax=Leptidea sinapis TaxID=189913 RepID=A0A5E4Q7Q8_9NEOP|nr:unnamed protein product [Leptidea sinapis]
MSVNNLSYIVGNWHSKDCLRFSQECHLATFYNIQYLNIGCLHYFDDYCSYFDIIITNELNVALTPPLTVAFLIKLKRLIFCDDILLFSNRNNFLYTIVWLFENSSRVMSMYPKIKFNIILLISRQNILNN